MNRTPYPSDVSDDEWAFVAPYLTLMAEDAPQLEHSLREVVHGLRWMVRAGAVWRMMPHDLPPWYTVSQQSQRWCKAGVVETLVIGLRELLRVAQGRPPQPSRPFSIAEPCNRRRRAAGEWVLTRPKAAVARKGT
jgi:transposase